MSKLCMYAKNNKLIIALPLLFVVIAAAFLLQLLFGGSLVPTIDQSETASGNNYSANSSVDAPIIGGDSEYIVVSNNSYARVEYGELPVLSTLVIKGKITDKSEELLIEGVDGAMPMCFTDTYVEIEEVYRGEPEGNTIAVRQEGGSKSVDGKAAFVSESNASLESGDVCILFLYQPNHGGAYNTEGDYYMITGGNQGVFLQAEDGLFTHQLEAYTERIDLQNFGAYIATVNEESPIDYDFYRNEIERALRWNYLESGVIESLGTMGSKGMDIEAEFEKSIENLDEYAKIIG